MTDILVILYYKILLNNKHYINIIKYLIYNFIITDNYNIYIYLQHIFFTDIFICLYNRISFYITFT